MNETSLGTALVPSSGRSLDEKSEWKRLLEEVFPSFDFIAGESFSLVKGTLECVDRRQNGFCGCIQRYILNRHDVTNLNSGQLSEQRLQRISMISFKSHKLKTERNPIAGRRYSDSFANHVSDHRVELSNYKLCKKAIASVLHCSLNFLYRDNNNKQKTIKKIEQIMAVPCCEKQCLAKLCTQHPDQVGRWRNKLEQKDSKSEDNRKVFFDLREHPLDPCIRAIGEITGLSKATLNNLSSKTRDTGIRHALQGRKRHPSNTETDRVRTFSNNSNSSIQSLNSASSIRTQSVIIPTPAVGYHYNNGTPTSISLETPPPRSHISPKIKINGPSIDNSLGMAKVEPIEHICVGSELPKLGNTQLLNDFDRQNLAEVIPIRPRLNAIKEEHADPEIHHLPKEDISPIEQYQPVYNEPISIEPLQKELTPSSVSPTIENSPGSNCDKPTKKRKAMPALKPLSDISDSSDPRSPQLRLPDVDTPSPFKKDKPDKPGGFKRLDSMGISSLALNTPTISPYTPSKFSTDKSCGSAQTPKSAHVFNFD